MPDDRNPTTPMSDERLAEIKRQAAALNYQPTKKAADELIAEVERLRAAPLASITRVEVIDYSPDGEGRAWSKWSLKKVTLSFQDEGRTLKMFVK